MDTWGIGPGKRLVRTKYLAKAIPERRSELLPAFPRLVVGVICRLAGYEDRVLWPAFTSYHSNNFTTSIKHAAVMSFPQI